MLPPLLENALQTEERARPWLHLALLCRAGAHDGGSLVSCVLVEDD